MDIPIQQISSTESAGVPSRRAILISESTVNELLKAFDDANQDLFFKVYIILSIDRLMIKKEKNEKNSIVILTYFIIRS